MANDNTWYIRTTTSIPWVTSSSTAAVTGEGAAHESAPRAGTPLLSHSQPPAMSADSVSPRDGSGPPGVASAALLRLLCQKSAEKREASARFYPEREGAKSPSLTPKRYPWTRAALKSTSENRPCAWRQVRIMVAKKPPMSTRRRYRRLEQCSLVKRARCSGSMKSSHRLSTRYSWKTYSFSPTLTRGRFPNVWFDNPEVRPCQTGRRLLFNTTVTFQRNSNRTLYRALVSEMGLGIQLFWNTWAQPKR
jgi:hypothetical protein